MRNAANTFKAKVEALLARPSRPSFGSPSFGSPSFGSPSVGSPRSPATAPVSAAATAATARQFVVRIEMTVASFERELELRKAVVRALIDDPYAEADADADADDAQARALGSLPTGWDTSARLLLSAWVLEPHLEHEQLDLLLESVAVEPGHSPGRRVR